MSHRNAPSVSTSSHVSGTILSENVEKQSFLEMAATNCSTQVLHNGGSESRLNNCDSTIIDDKNCSTRLYHRRRKSLSGLWRRGAIYHYRVRVPVDLAGSLQKTHISRSLRTTSIIDARRVVRKIAYDLEVWFDSLRKNGAACDAGLNANDSVLLVSGSAKTLSGKIVQPVMTFSTVCDLYLNDPTSSRTEKSAMIYRTTFTTIASILGPDKPLQSISRENCRELLELASALVV